mgnify:CR=1 FL=1
MIDADSGVPLPRALFDRMVAAKNFHAGMHFIRQLQLALQQASYAKQQRQIAHLQAFVDRFRAKATKAARKKAIVAMARQMAVDLWRWRTGKVKPADLGWVMVGVPA